MQQGNGVDAYFGAFFGKPFYAVDVFGGCYGYVQGAVPRVGGGYLLYDADGAVLGVCQGDGGTVEGPFAVHQAYFGAFGEAQHAYAVPRFFFGQFEGGSDMGCVENVHNLLLYFLYFLWVRAVLSCVFPETGLVASGCREGDGALSDYHADECCRHAGCQHAAYHRQGPVSGQHFSLAGCQHADASDLHSDGADVGKSAQCKCSDNYGFFLYEGSCVFQGVEVGVGDKFVEHHLGSQQAADGGHVFFADAHEPCQRGENPPDKCLEVELHGSPV